MTPTARIPTIIASETTVGIVTWCARIILTPTKASKNTRLIFR
jgi:hypothetical protein